MSESDTSSLVTLPASLAESLFRVKGQRRFASLNEDYAWPCDSVASRLEMVMGAIYGKNMYPNGLYYEPRPGMLEEVFARRQGGSLRIVDLGSGLTATWCVSMAQKFPDAEVIGIWSLASSPTSLQTCRLRHDLLEGIPFPDEWFDLVHLRGGGHSARFLDNPDVDLVPDIVRALKPGGVLLIEGEDSAGTHDAFFSRTPDNPILDVVKGRHRARTETVKARHVQVKTQSVDLLTRLRNEDVLRDSIETATFELPLGADPAEGPPEGQIGSLCREAVLSIWEIDDAAAGLDEKLIEELKTIDRVLLPEQDQGLFLKAGVVWASKSREGS